MANSRRWRVRIFSPENDKVYLDIVIKAKKAIDAMSRGLREISQQDVPEGLDELSISVEPEEG